MAPQRTRYVPCQPPPPCFIQRLSADTLVDDIFIYLHVEDILCLRRVNKAFYILSHTPSIWKRLLIKLQRLRYLIPPLPPLPHHTFSNADLDVEQLVVRAITVDENWRSPYSPKLYNKAIFNVGGTVIDMKLVLGGKYFVVSTKDSSNHHCNITIFNMDHPSGPQPLAKVDTISAAFQLDVKYAKLLGYDGLWIGFIRREFKPIPRDEYYGSDDDDDLPMPDYDYFCNIHPEDYPYDMKIDPPPGYVFSNQLVCYHVPLDTLEMLADPRMEPGSPEYIKKFENAPDPFLDRGGYRTSGVISNMTLFQYQSKPTFTAILDDRFVICSPMVQPFRDDLTYMKLAPVPEFEDNLHLVEAVYPLPNQGSLLVARKILVGRRLYIGVLEIYDIPTEPSIYRENDDPFKSKYHRVLADRDIVSIQIAGSDAPITLPEEIVSSDPPHPISVYVRIRQLGVAHYSIYPSPVELVANKLGFGPRRYRFTLDTVAVQSVHITRPYDCHILPGVHKSILYNFAPEYTVYTTVASFRRHISSSDALDENHIYNPQLPEEEQVSRRGRANIPFKLYVTIDTPGLLEEINGNGGLAAITWDESIGRICFTSGNDTCVRVLDYGQITHPDSRLKRWKLELAARQRLERWGESSY